MASLAGSGAATARRPEQIRADIDRARAEIARSVAELSAEVTARADWREWVRRRPSAILGGAFLVGLWLGSRD
jgi:hypothetical protein